MCYRASQDIVLLLDMLIYAEFVVKEVDCNK